MQCWRCGPWTANTSQERRFKRLLGIVFAAILVLGLVWPFLPTKAVDPYEQDEIPPRIAQLLLERQLTQCVHELFVLLIARCVRDWPGVERRQRSHGEIENLMASDIAEILV